MNTTDQLAVRRDQLIGRCTCGAWVWIPRGHCGACGAPCQEKWTGAA